MSRRGDECGGDDGGDDGVDGEIYVERREGDNRECSHRPMEEQS